MLAYLIPAAAGAIAFLLGWLLHKMLVNKEIGGATAEAERILAEARRGSETLRKEIILEGREKIGEERARELEKLREKQSRLDRRENDLERLGQQVERTRESLDNRQESLSQQETALGEMEQALLAKHQRANKLLEEQNARLEEVAQMSADLDKGKKAVGAVDLMTIPSQGYDNDQQTPFDKIFSEITTKVGMQGDGSGPGSREKIVFFVSDGVADHKKGPCTGIKRASRCHEPIDPKICRTLKERNIKVAVLYTTYQRVPRNGYYMANVD
ncbi:MAG TPA: Rnase Y domain-containing protein, partial [Candidatus Sabulitectum sp.]|nr:Rnase Y domain-containing protein [Candidatus Sabulitectum sp.]